jgi:RES domain-containing protein
MIPYSHYPDFLAVIRSLVTDGRAGPWNGIFYRYTSTKYATGARMMSGSGAFQAGGRWNAPRAFHAVYCASNPELANREYFAGYRAAGFPIHKALPLVGKAVRVALDRVLDFQDPAVLGRLGITPDQLARDRWKEATDAGRESLCQALGRAAFEAGVEALLVASAYGQDSGDYNLVLILENAPPDSGKWTVVRGGA